MPIFFFILFASLAIVLNLYSITARASALEEWAQENHFEIIHREPRLLRKGPYSFTGKHQHVYYVTLKTSAGNIRNAFVRIGRSMPFIPHRIDVCWD